MGVQVRAACLQDGLAVLNLLEHIGYYPEPVSYAKTFRKTLGDPHFLLRVAELDGKVVGMATLSMRYQLGLGGLLATLDELAVSAEAGKGVDELLLQATVGRARALGARRVVIQANEGRRTRKAELARSA